MIKDDVLSRLKKAKTAHLRWRTYAEALVSGVDEAIDQLPVKHTDCEFGHWYHGDGQELSHLDLFNEIGLVHQALHEEFEIIFDIVTSANEAAERSSFLKRLLGSKVKMKQENKEKALEHLVHLKMISKKLVGKIEELESMLVKGQVEFS